MTDATYSSLPSIVNVVRWTARILSILILLFWGFFIIGHLIGDAGRSSRPLIANDYIILAAMLASLAGLGIAWKWELLGAVITLVAVLIEAVINWRVLVFPGTLIPIVAFLFLLCWWMSRMQIGKQPQWPAMN